MTSGFEYVIDSYLSEGVTNSEVLFNRLESLGYTGSKTTIKNYIARHRNLVPAKRKLVASNPQSSRGRRFETRPGEAYQMDWGFVRVEDWTGSEFRIACFAMVCHHCGTCYIEFFPNARQENLFIGMTHAFIVMGVPEYVLTDNMKTLLLVAIHLVNLFGSLTMLALCRLWDLKLSFVNRVTLLLKEK